MAFRTAFDEQLKRIRACIKNKLFELTKEFKYFKCQQNLRIEFEKEGVLNEIKFVDPWFVSCKKEFEDINIDEFIDKQQNDLSMGVASWIHEGSG